MPKGKKKKDNVITTNSFEQDMATLLGKEVTEYISDDNNQHNTPIQR